MAAHGSTPGDGGGVPRVAVVGGGVSGLFCALCLARPELAGMPGAAAPRVTVLEASERLGGRLMPFGPGSQDLGAEFVHGSSTLLSQLAAENGWQLRRLAVWAQGDGGPPVQEAPDGGAAYYIVRDGGKMKALRFNELDGAAAGTMAAVRAANGAHKVLQGSLLEAPASDARPLGQAMLDHGCSHRAVAPGGGSLFGAGYANTACAEAGELSAGLCATTERAWEKDEEGEEEDEDGADFRLEGGYAVLLDWLVKQLGEAGVRLRPGCAVSEVDATAAEEAAGRPGTAAAPDHAARGGGGAGAAGDALPGEMPALWGRLAGVRGVTLRGVAASSDLPLRTAARRDEAEAALLDAPPAGSSPRAAMAERFDVAVVTTPPHTIACEERVSTRPGDDGTPRIEVLPPLPPIQAACMASVQCEPAIKVVCRFREPAWPADAHGAVFERPAAGPGPTTAVSCAPWFPEVWFSTDSGIGSRVVSRAETEGTADEPARCTFHPAPGGAPERGGHAVAVGFATGDAARALMRCGPAHLVSSLAGQLGVAFGLGATSRLAGGFVGRWGRAYTSPSLAEGRADGAVRAALSSAGWAQPDGGSAARRVMQTPHAGGAVLFAGEACAGADEALDSPMTVHGAMATGRRAAAAVLHALSGPAAGAAPVPQRLLPSAGILRALRERKARL